MRESMAPLVKRRRSAVDGALRHTAEVDRSVLPLGRFSAPTTLSLMVTSGEPDVLPVTAALPVTAVRFCRCKTHAEFDWPCRR